MLEQPPLNETSEGYDLELIARERKLRDFVESKHREIVTGARTRVSEYLRGRSYRQVLRRLTDVRDWSGGTRIGESLAQFNREWPHLVDRRTIVIVLSDGWDTGEPDVLATELTRIKRRAARVIWLLLAIESSMSPTVI